MLLLLPLLLPSPLSLLLLPLLLPPLLQAANAVQQNCRRSASPLKFGIIITCFSFVVAAPVVVAASVRCTNLACQLHVGAAREIALRCCWCSFLALAWAPTQAQSVNLAAEWLATASCKCQLLVATVAVACAEVSESVLEKRRAMGMQTAEHTQAQPRGAQGQRRSTRRGGTVVSFAAVSVCFLSCSSLLSLRSAQWCKTMHA